MQDSSTHNRVVVPDFLYHYTTVESLAAILKNRNIRLVPLTNLDDLQEGKCSSSYNFARFMFVSSWTEDSFESIPMWNMYAQMERGVRIKLPSMPIAEYEFTPEDRAIIPHNIDFNSTNRKTILPFKRILSMQCTPYPYTRGALLRKIKYTTDRALLEPEVIVSEPDGSFTIKFGKLGLNKNVSWEFQKEWRFLIWMMPISIIEAIASPEMALHFAHERYKNNLYSLPFNSFYLDIDDIAFSQMEVTLNPKISEGSRAIVHLLKKEYNPSMTIVESILANTIR